jgi:hypothetical protein
MAVLIIQCPDCQHCYQSLVMDSTTVPTLWYCSHCGGQRAAPIEQLTANHPLEQVHGSGCLCCGTIPSK